MNTTDKLGPTLIDPEKEQHYRIRPVPALAAFGWLRLGWADLRATGFRGVFYGLVFALMGTLLLTIYQTQWELTMALTAGFMLLGPFVCTGIYELSRQREGGGTPDLSASMTCWRRNTGAIGFYAALLTLLLIFWARTSVVIFALFSNSGLPSMQDMLGQIFSLGNLEFLAVWAGAGFIFASLAFAISVVSAPMLLDRRCDAMTAMFTSARALLANALPVYVWAAMIVLLIGASLVLWFGLLLITAPLIGHATWHGYRALVAVEPG